MKTSSLQLNQLPSLAGTLSIKSMLQSSPKHAVFILEITHQAIAFGLDGNWAIRACCMHRTSVCVCPSEK